MSNSTQPLTSQNSNTGQVKVTSHSRRAKSHAHAECLWTSTCSTVPFFNLVMASSEELFSNVHSPMGPSSPGKKCSPTKWSPGTWQDDTRKSAFLPYKPTTVLTNLQRGNIPAENATAGETEISFYHQAGQGEITLADLQSCLDIDHADSTGLNALMWASAYGQVTTVQLLLQGGASVNHQGTEGATALLLAASNGQYDVLHLLISQGATVDHRDDYGNTALMFAAFGNHGRCVNELLLNGADMTLQNLAGENAFGTAVATQSRSAQDSIEKFVASMLN